MIGAYAALTKADGAAFRFPRTAEVYDHCLAQFTEAQALARASLWAATAGSAQAQAFNYVHEPFRWRRVWEKVAAHFGLETGEPIPFSLAERFGDFVFGSAFDVLSDTSKIRVAGFAETLDPAEALIAAIEQQIAADILPRP